MRRAKPSAQHAALRLKVLNLLQQEARDIDAIEVVAILSYTLGQLIAFLDQRKITSDQVMDMVGANIEEGNAQAIAEGIVNTRGNA